MPHSSADRARTTGSRRHSDGSGNAYVSGVTTSDDFPTTPGAFQTRRGSGVSAYVAKVNGDGTSLAYSTYLGGNNTTEAFGLAVDAAGSAYVTGATNASDFPVTAGAYGGRPKPGGQGGDVFVSKLHPAGSSLVYSTVFGGTGPDFGMGIALDGSGNAYIAGRALPYGNGRRFDFPTTVDAVQRCGAGNPRHSSPGSTPPDRT